MTLDGCLNCLPALENLIKVKSIIKRKKLLVKSSSKIIYAISEIVRNILKGNVPLSPKQRLKLNQYKAALRELSKKTLSLKKRRVILNQKGGALSAILIPAITFLSSLIAGKA